MIRYRMRRYRLLHLRNRSRDFRMRCIMCGNVFRLDELFCLLSLRGANSLCYNDNHPVVCNNCLKRLKEVLEGMEL